MEITRQSPAAPLMRRTIPGDDFIPFRSDDEEQNEANFTMLRHRLTTTDSDLYLGVTGASRFASGCPAHRPSTLFNGLLRQCLQGTHRPGAELPRALSLSATATHLAFPCELQPGTMNNFMRLLSEISCKGAA